MLKRPQAREIPAVDRYFKVPLPCGKTTTLRFPSYQKAMRLIELLSVFQKGDGLAKLVQMLDVAGLAIGVCWWHPELDLEAGPAPRIPRPADGVGELTPEAFGGEGAEWRSYGEAVCDELQDWGLQLEDLLGLVNAIAEKAFASMGELSAAEERTGN